jgi:hypothetical protein
MNCQCGNIILAKLPLRPKSYEDIQSLLACITLLMQPPPNGGKQPSPTEGCG